MFAFRIQRGLIIWFLLEINFISFIGVLTQSLNSSNPNRNLYYFLIQSLGRVIILIRFFSRIIISSFLFNIFFFLSLILKLGGVPFHFWYLKLIQKLRWKLIWLLSIWQKLIPLLLLTLRRLKFLIFFGGLRVLIRRVSTWNQKKIKKILGLSSIFSLGWVLFSFVISSRVWVLFIIGYGLSLLALVITISKINYLHLNKRDRSSNAYIIRVFIIGLLILRGIPPFVGFFLKIFILAFLVQIRFFLSLIILLSRLYLIFVYLIIIFIFLTYVKSSYMINIQNKKLLFIELAIFNIFIIVLILNLLFCIIIHK